MIYVLITVKPSVRFPGKNKLLAKYTINWLMSEINNIKEEVTVYTIGTRTELPEILPLNWKHIEYYNDNHQAVLQYAENIINPDNNDIFVLAQVTNPLRRNGLLEDVVNKAREFGNCITACCKQDESWRKLNVNGCWTNKSSNKELYHDRALYAYQPGKVNEIFDNNIPHGIVINCNNFIDIDNPEDLNQLIPLS